MMGHTYCESCDKKTNALKYWFEKFLCPKCYELARSKPQTILVSNITE
jgi:predicted RNA-binding Zn-ribbon protein involved in translation (DUF1610 family)